MIRRSRSLLAALLLAIAGVAIAAAPASAVTAAPAWRVSAAAAPTNFVPGVTDGHNLYIIHAVNVGGAPTDGSPVTVSVDLPAGFSYQPSPSVGTLAAGITDDYQGAPSPCTAGAPITCQLAQTIFPGERVTLNLPVQAPASGPAAVTSHVTVSGGGAAAPASVDAQTPFNADPVPFGIQQTDFSLTDVDGSAFTQAGGHPAHFRFDYRVNTTVRGGKIVSAEDLRDAAVTLPPGLVVDPTATPHCTEVEFEINECADSSTVGTASLALGFGYPAEAASDPVFNLQPPHGKAAALGFNAVGLGFFIHVLGGVDPAHNYALEAGASDVTQVGGVSETALNLWGDPSDPAYDALRNACLQTGHTTNCPVPHSDKPFLTMPSACSTSLSSSMVASSWQNQSPGTPVTASTMVTDNSGAPQGVSGCDQLAFAPTLTARPTTNVADSPSGLDVDLQVPQDNNVNTKATSTLKKTVVTLPEGLTLNPSAANGLAACSSSQVGIDPNTGTPNGDQPTCPDASKLGTVEVTTPLLDNPLPGSVYLAKPHDNPFDSMLALYIVIDDPQSGVIIKLAGKVQADPNSGRLTTTVDQNPQLPFSEFKLNFFGGATGALRTPNACGSYQTNSELTPWSDPDNVANKLATPQDTYSIDQGPGAGGDCSAAADQQPNSPSFDAGTVTPTAGTHSPFVLNLHRDDATQQFSSVTLSPPPGLVAKLAGTPACSDAGIAQAQGRTASGDGALEQSDPSCPDTSKVGVVHVGAGAGPSPYYVTGNVYLAGPYKNQPLSFVIITPAVAGPFDLGVVVTRVAISIDPTTAQITATADPIPDHLTVDGDGFPLDVRSVQMKLDKPDFTLNGSSCDPTSISGSLLSTQGQSAALSEPFQLAECANLGFKPRLGMRLRGGHFRNGHPAFTSVLNARAGDANIGKASVILPPSMQLDQSHIQAPCTRPQFAADQCPAASVIGSVVATSPLLDYKLTGPVYLRTGDNPLPDIVLDLHGPASQPIRIDQVGKIDTVHARLRTTFQGVPDAPISQAIIRLVGGHKGLLVNNTNLCKQPNRAAVFLDGHNNATADSHPRIALKCPKARKKHKQHKRHHRRHHTRHAGR